MPLSSNSTFLFTAKQQSAVCSALLTHGRNLLDRDAEDIPKPYGFGALISDLLSLAFADLRANTFVIPAMHALNVFLENDLPYMLPQIDGDERLES